ncbi:MAG: type IV pilus twitching motility protein PilT [Elusimicrobia bacterium]|nr:type IV pilus twitching motility protein PilT [Elusimicrobiota bacterium]
MDIKEILQAAVKYNASDIHIVPGRPPMLRINGQIRSLNTDKLSSDDTQRIIFGALSEKLVDKFKKENELDTSLSAEGIGRFRVNVLEQKDGIGAVLRVIPSKIPTPQDVGLDQILIDLTHTPRGMILVTGPTGSGKSTTLASMVNLINTERKEHILTIEDPIEYVYPKLNCVVTQREIGSHSINFNESLKRAMRQDPDIVLIGEMRDLETIGAALTLSETGHLVFGTLHTTDAAQTVDRIIDVFPPFQQQQVRTQLSVVLRAVICQQLIPKADGQGRVAAREVMIVNPAISNLIREGKTHQIYNAIEVGSKVGMKSLDKNLAELVAKKVVTFDAAITKANNPNMLRQMTMGGGRG